MNMCKHTRQALEKSIRNTQRQGAAARAKKAGANRIEKTPAVNLGFDRNAKRFEMPTN